MYLCDCSGAELPTCAGGRSCGCTVPSLHPSHRDGSLTPPRLLLRPSRSYWPLLRHTADPLGTGGTEGESMK